MTMDTSGTQTHQVDMLVLGSGEGGKYLAWHAANAGKRAVVIERRWVGGSCPNVNCLPSKNEVHSAKVAHTVSQAAAFGVHVEASHVDMQRVLARKQEMVQGLVTMHLERYRASGAELVRGEGRFIGPRTIEIALEDGSRAVYEGERVILSVGSRSVVPALPGLRERALTHIELLELDRVPEHLIVLGGGYVGLEFAQAYRRFGARVTLVERGARLLSREDPETSEALRQMFVDEGVDVLFQSEAQRVDGVADLTLRTPEGERRIAGSHILVATGRRPNTENIGLDLAGIALDEHGFVQVNERLQTSAPNVWAVGDCAGSPQFTHAAFDDFRVVRDNLAGNPRSTQGRLVPSCMFTDPPLARVGLNEAEAHATGIAVRVATLQAREILRTRTTGESRGFLKVLVDRDSDVIRGFTMFGVDAGEVVAVVQTGMLAQLPYQTLRDAILTHPTMAEGLNTLLSRVAERSV